MKTEEIKDLLISGKYSELRDKFTQIDQKSNSIHGWQKIWGLPLQSEGCQLAHKLRNHICTFILHYFGNRFHSDKPGEFKAIAEGMNKPDALATIEVIEDTREELTNVYAKIAKFLYP